MASCRQVDMSPSPTVDMSLLLQTSCPLRLGGHAPAMSSDSPGSPRRATTGCRTGAAGWPQRRRRPTSPRCGSRRRRCPRDADSAAFEVPVLGRMPPGGRPRGSAISLNLSFIPSPRSSVRPLRGSLGEPTGLAISGNKKGRPQRRAPLDVGDSVVQLPKQHRVLPRAPKSSRTYATAALTIRRRRKARPYLPGPIRGGSYEPVHSSTCRYGYKWPCPYPFGSHSPAHSASPLVASTTWRLAAK
jgi:hypothetical protein